MYGQSIETLRVKVGDQVLWEISGSQGNNWYKATVPLNYDGIYVVRNYNEKVLSYAFSNFATALIPSRSSFICSSFFPPVFYPNTDGYFVAYENSLFSVFVSLIPEPAIV